MIYKPWSVSHNPTTSDSTIQAVKYLEPEAHSLRSAKVHYHLVAMMYLSAFGIGGSHSSRGWVACDITVEPMLPFHPSTGSLSVGRKRW